MQNMFDNIREQDYDQNMKFKKQRGSSKSHKTSIVRMWLSYNFGGVFRPTREFFDSNGGVIDTREGLQI